MKKLNKISKNKGGEVTTQLGSDVHKIIRKYSDPVKYDDYRERWKKAANLEEIPSFPIQIDFGVSGWI